ncbi:hypothetical protein OSTOST_13605 [Ostertagia ostertagi]
MVAARRRSQAAQVSPPAAKKEVHKDGNSRKPAAKKGPAKKQKNVTSKKQSPKKNADVQEIISETFVAVSEQSKVPRKRGPAVRKEDVEAKGRNSLGKRSLPIVKAPVEGKKPRVGTKSPATRAKPGKRNLETPDSEEVRKDEEVVADSANSSKEAPKLDVEKDLLHEEGKVAEQMKQEETHDQSFGDSKSANDEKQDTAQKSTPKQDDDDWENFGNTSDEEESIAASEPVKKKKKVKPKTLHLSHSRKAYTLPDTETEASSVAEDPDDSDASFTPSKAQQPKRGSGGKGGGSSRPQARSSKTERFAQYFLELHGVPFQRRHGGNLNCM